ncbi:MAG: dihydropteroate synthase [Thermodesulfobacteriota bacterium]
MRRVSWTVAGGRVLGPAPFFVAGIVNVTPDSFSDGGRHLDPRHALSHARRLLDEGADILDVGGESTRPGAAEVPAAEELARVLPVVETASRLAGPQGASAVVSVDTSKAAVAEKALAAGAAIVNDVSACRSDPGLLDVVAGRRPGYVLMHRQGTPRTMQAAPRYGDVVAEIAAFFEERLSALVRAGLPEDRVVLDPGIGFGKTLAHNLEILRRLPEFLYLGRPLYLGLSNKSLWGALLGLPVDRRGEATRTATALAALRGASVHRVHEVAQAKAALRLALALDPEEPLPPEATEA